MGPDYVQAVTYLGCERALGNVRGLHAVGESSTICALRQARTDPELCSTVRNSRLPSPLVISRTRTRSAVSKSLREEQELSLCEPDPRASRSGLIPTCKPTG